MDSKLLEAFRYHRALYGADTPKRAVGALIDARRDLAAGKDRFYSATSSAAGAPFNVGRSVCRWIERPADLGLRLVGFADEVAKRAVDHKGWFLDDDFQDEVARGVVFQLPGRDGKPIYVHGLADPFNDGPAVVCFEMTDDEKDAALSADEVARMYAENERDYRRASNARARFDELAEDIEAARRKALALISSLKAARARIADAAGLEALCESIREKVADLRDSIRDARAERARLQSDFGREAAWNDA